MESIILRQETAEVLKQKKVLDKIWKRLEHGRIRRFGRPDKTFEESQKLVQSNMEHFGGMHQICRVILEEAKESGDQSVLNLDFEMCRMMIDDHDMPELITGDEPGLKSKEIILAEKEAISTLEQEDSLGAGYGEIARIYEDKSAEEARFVKSIDLLEVLIQMLSSGRIDAFRYSSVEDMDAHAGKFCKEFTTLDNLYQHLRGVYKKKSLFENRS